MKHNLLTFTALALLVLNSCTKKETIIQEYNPPQPKLFGTWRVIGQNTTDTNFYVFPNDGTNFMFMLYKTQQGFRNIQSAPFKSTDNQIQIYGSLYNYKVSNDTLTMMESTLSSFRLVKINNPSFTPSNWMITSSIIKKINMPTGTGYYTRPFGIEGNYLYLYGNINSSQKIYKFNHTNGISEDSGAVSEPATVCVKSGTLYTAFDNGTYNIYKSTTSNIGSMSIISNNALPYANAISVNPNSGVIYTYCGDGKIYTGTENSTFNELFNCSNYGIGNVLYYKNDEFLCMRGGIICKVSIAPEFKVLANYAAIPGYNVYQLATNGSEIWCSAYENSTGQMKLMKLNLQ